MKSKLSTDEKLWLEQVKAWKANQLNAIETSQSDIDQARHQIKSYKKRLSLSINELKAKQKQLNHVEQTVKLFKKRKGIK